VDGANDRELLLDGAWLIPSLPVGLRDGVVEGFRESEGRDDGSEEKVGSFEDSSMLGCRLGNRVGTRELDGVEVGARGTVGASVMVGLGVGFGLRWSRLFRFFNSLTNLDRLETLLPWLIESLLLLLLPLLLPP
jgi:hypothetical protein